jgi:RNA polymerase sigma-70 factor (ECF subfamily)
LPEPLKGVSLKLIVNSSSEEKELIQRAKEGDCDAFKKLFHANAPRVYSLSLRLTCDTVAAEELTQDVFIKAWEKLNSFRSESKFFTWLHSIAVNEFLMSKRSAKRLFARVFTTDDLSSHEKRPSDSNIPYDANIDLERAISTLPKQSKMVFVLHDIEGYMHHEIAEIMKVEVGTSKSHLHRARKLLREALLK